MGTHEISDYEPNCGETTFSDRLLIFAWKLFVRLASVFENLTTRVVMGGHERLCVVMRGYAWLCVVLCRFKICCRFE